MMKIPFLVQRHDSLLMSMEVTCIYLFRRIYLFERLFSWLLVSTPPCKKVESRLKWRIFVQDFYFQIDDDGEFLETINDAGNQMV